MQDTVPALNLNDTSLAFRAKSDAQLKRAFWLFKMIDSPFLTKVGPKMLQFGLDMGLPLEGVVRSTIFELFVGGESLKDTARTTRHLAEFGVKTILDYSVEGEKTEAGFDATRDEILDTIRHGGKHEAVAFSACKMTGLGDFDLMAKIQAKRQLTEAESEAFTRMIQRIEEIAALAAEEQTPIFIDAEESWIQEVIDEIAEGLMERYNQTKPVIFTTVQHYRWDRLEYLKGLIQRSKEKGYILGVKLVRGAYLEKERLRAEEMGYPDPIQPNKAASDKDYNAALELCMEHLDHVAICAGTHNDQSSLYLTELMQAKGVAPGHPYIWFAQLLGMSDNISFNLSHAGYNVAKYLPYGPVKSVLPYLIRRAEENTSVAGQASRETSLLGQEVRRRKSC